MLILQQSISRGIRGMARPRARRSVLSGRSPDVFSLRDSSHPLRTRLARWPSSEPLRPAQDRPIVLPDGTVSSARRKSTRVADREHPCLAAYQATWKRSLIAADRKRMICAYAAADTETMRRIQRGASAEFDRIWVGEAIEWEGVRPGTSAGY
jgi:hypothetical protein